QRGVRLLFVSLPLATLALYFGLRHLYTLIGQLPIEELLQQQAALGGFEKIPVLFWRLLEYSAAGTLLGFFLPATYPTPAAWIAVAALAAGGGGILWRGTRAGRRGARSRTGHARAVGRRLPDDRRRTREPLRPAQDIPGSGRDRRPLSLRWHHPDRPAVLPRAAARRPPTRAAGHPARARPPPAARGPGVRPRARLPGLRAIPPGLALALGLGVLVYGRHQSGFRIDERPSCHDYFLYMRQQIADTIAAAPRGATVHLENGTTPAYVLGPP